MTEPTVLHVFLLALGTALATGLGALPLLFAHRIPARWIGLGNALAAGLMITASFQLVGEGLHVDVSRTLIGIVLGLGFIVLAERWLDGREDVDVAHLRGADAKRALLIMGVMTLHSFAEGIGVGVAFGGGAAFGLFIALAIAIHNVPEGLAISLAMVPKGLSVGRAAAWSVVSSLPQPLIAVPAFLFVQRFEPFLPVGLGLAAGAMIWMAVSELLPEALEHAHAKQVGIAVTVAVVAMTGFQAVLPG